MAESTDSERGWFPGDPVKVCTCRNYGNPWHASCALGDAGGCDRREDEGKPEGWKPLQAGPPLEEMPRCKFCCYRLPHGPGGCIVRAGLKAPAETAWNVIDGLDAQVKQLRAVIGGLKLSAQGEIWRFRAEEAETRVKQLEAELAEMKKAEQRPWWRLF